MHHLPKKFSLCFKYLFSQMLIHFPINFMRNVMSIIFLQQIINGRLLLVVMGEQKSNLNCRFKLESITTYHL